MLNRFQGISSTKKNEQPKCRIEVGTLKWGIWW